MFLKLLNISTIILVFSICVFSQQVEKTNNVNSKPDSISIPDCRIQVVQNENTGYGYKIYLNDKLYINQPNIPAVSGIKSFSSYKDAEMTAGLVKIKLQKDIFPPGICVKELDSIEIKN